MVGQECLTIPLLTQTILEASSVVSDQDRFDTAYEAFRDLSAGLYDIDTTRYSRGVTSEDAPGVELADGEEKLRDLVHLPRNWPLARLTIPLGGLSKQIDRLLEGYNRDPDAHNGKVIQTATHLTWILAEYLADTIAWLMRSILDNVSKILFDNEQLYALLFDKATRGSQKNPYEEKAYRGPGLTAVQTWWEKCKEWMEYFKGQSAPRVPDLQGRSQVLRGGGSCSC